MLDALLQRLRRVQKAQRRGGRLLWLHKGEAACGAQATARPAGRYGRRGRDARDARDARELGEVLLAAVARSGEEAGASTRARFAGGSTGPKGPDGCATAADRRLRGHTAAALAFAGGDGRNRPRPEDPAPIRQAVPSRTQREQARSGVTSHLTLECGGS